MTDSLPPPASGAEFAGGGFGRQRSALLKRFVYGGAEFVHGGGIIRDFLRAGKFDIMPSVAVSGATLEESARSLG